MAVTGKGKAPLASVWVGRALYKQANETDHDTAESTYLSDWFFDAAVAPPAGTTNRRTLMGVGT